MAHFASLDTDNSVIKVHCVNNKQLLDVDGSESEEYGIMYLRTLHKGGRYKQTSYNTRGGVHKLGGTPLRANYCGKGWHYDPDLDIFHPPQPYPSWTLDTVKGHWNCPVPYPEIEVVEGEMPPRYSWNEDEQQWDEMEMPSE
jgi:hypothetical protein